jgi:phosphoenolpyruvate synthase/pyruvate phosphate dikinase
MSSYVLDFQDIDKSKLMVVGGKGANLGELSRIEGIIVPDGFCISTEAFKRIIGETSSLAIAGLPVSSGVIEGRARVILNMEDAELEEGDILVTTFT